MSDKKECCVTYCEGTGKLVPVCTCNHYMHLDCLKNMVKNQQVTKCPMCRDDFLEELKQVFHTNSFVSSNSEDDPIYNYIPPEPPVTNAEQPRIYAISRWRVSEDLPLFVPKRHPRNS